tara:strand:+ start:62 stop:202 length:141 start_codon:yes stop_codon:yes gene_type:complete
MDDLLKHGVFFLRNSPTFPALVNFIEGSFERREQEAVKAGVMKNTS